MRAGLFARHEKDNAQVAATGAVLRDIPAATNLGVSLHQAPALMVKAEYVQYDAKAVKKTVTAAVSRGWRVNTLLKKNIQFEVVPFFIMEADFAFQ